MTDIMEIARTTKHTSVKLGRTDLCVGQPSHAYDCMGGDAGFNIQHKGNARSKPTSSTGDIGRKVKTHS